MKRVDLPHIKKIDDFLVAIKARKLTLEDGFIDKFVDNSHYSLLSCTTQVDTTSKKLLMTFYRSSNGNFSFLIKDIQYFTNDNLFLVLLNTGLEGWLYNKREIINNYSNKLWTLDNKGLRVNISEGSLKHENAFLSPKDLLLKLGLPT